MVSCRIAVLCSDRSYRDGLIHALGDSAIDVAASHEMSSYRGLPRAQFDILLLDSGVRDALSLCGRLQVEPACRVVFVKAPRDDVWCIKALIAGARGILYQRTPTRDVVEAVARVREGHLWAPRRLVDAALTTHLNGGMTPEHDTRAAPDRRPVRAATAVIQRPRSAAERWAVLVLKACESACDLKTLADWAAFVGVSYSSLCEGCRLISVRPQHARDLARVLRAVIKSIPDRVHPHVLLDVSDRRTLRCLLDKANIREQEFVSMEQFLDHQQFVSDRNEGLIALRALLSLPES